MISGFLASARRWIATAGLAVAVTVPSFTGAAIAAPFVPMPQVAAPSSAENGVTQIRDRRFYRGRGGWRGDRGYYRGYRDGRRHYRHHRGRNYGGLALGLGVGVPLGAYLASRPAYGGGYYDDYYDRPYYRDRYVVRRVNPRPVYRSGGGHANWCYNRYRSYRASDNTFQPYNGPRQQCYSPYS